MTLQCHAIAGFCLLFNLSRYALIREEGSVMMAAVANLKTVRYQKQFCPLAALLSTYSSRSRLKY